MNCLKNQTNGHIFAMNSNEKLHNKYKILNFDNPKPNFMTLFQRIKPVWIIHIFALLHLGTALCCRLAGVDDELFLTILTMAMIMIVCLKKNLSIEFTASMVIVGNILGFLIGTLGANILGLLFTSPYVVQPVSTLMTTELLGWGIVAIANIFKVDRAAENSGYLSSPYLKWIMLAAGFIFILRLGVVLVFAEVNVDSASIYSIIQDILTNSVGLLILICLNILYIRYSDRNLKEKQRLYKTTVLSAFVVTAALIETLIIGFGIPIPLYSGFNGSFILIFTISLLAEITIYCIIFIINYALTARGDMQKQRERAHLAQYRYMKLKGQVNPHFLFNSLNILNCLVCEEKNEQASTYIHKLAGIYRYMIKSEDEELVKLSDELIFIEKYTDLLKVRFTEGLQIEMNIADDCLNKLILPCSLQLLIENATKHNAVSADNPLKIRIEASDGTARVRNNIIPKIAHSQSTGLGHKYISRQYLDLCGKSIEIDITENDYCVTLPLL